MHLLRQFCSDWVAHSLLKTRHLEGTNGKGKGMDILVFRKVWLYSAISVAILPVLLRPLAAQESSVDGSELRQIWDRLEQLERQNAQLVERNARLERMVDPHGVQEVATSTEMAASGQVDSPADCGCCKRCPPCDFCSCLCPQPPAPCIECPHVSTLQPYWNVNIFGALVTDILLSTARPIAPGTPFLLGPDSLFGFETDSFSMHARQSMFGMALSGPEIGGLQTGGLVLVNFYNDAVIVDRYGFLPLQAYGELKNEDVRFAAGLQFDVFCPNTANILPFSILSGSGNAGNNFRGQVRMERFIRPSDRTQWTLQFAISEPISTAITPDLTVTEDNGWPNVEGRVMYGSGPPEQIGAEVRRPFEVGLSGVVGQVRRTGDIGGVPTRVVSDVWGVGLDWRWKMTDRFGMQGELVHGQGLGTYNAGILQTINAERFTAVQTSGGWLEAWYYWTPCLHSHFGYAIDDPLDRDLATVNAALSAPVRNETWFANCLWDVTPSFRAGFEFTWRETAYDKLPDAEGAGFHTQFRWSF